MKAELIHHDDDDTLEFKFSNPVADSEEEIAFDSEDEKAEKKEASTRPLFGRERESMCAAPTHTHTFMRSTASEREGREEAEAKAERVGALRARASRCARERERAWEREEA